MTNPIKIAMTAAFTLVLGGCSNMLYSNSVAPVYSKTQVKGQVAATPRRSGHTAPPIIAIENTNRGNSQPIVVSEAQKDPYARNPRGTVAVRPNQPQPVQAQVAETVASAEQSVAQTQQPVRAERPAVTPRSESVLSESAKAARSNDPRIREASEVLSAERAAVAQKTKEAEQLAEAAQQVASSNRPAAVKQAAAKRAEVAKQAAEQAKRDMAKKAEQVTQKSVAKTTTAATQTVKKAQTAVATTTAKAQTATTAATAAVKPPKPASPTTATKSLLKEARAAVAAGQYDKAASALERAHRIQPGNAKILYDIAQIRYAQGNYRQAESFASKAANYSKSSALSKKIWTILANSRRALGNTTGAEAASKKAANF